MEDFFKLQKDVVIRLIPFVPVSTPYIYNLIDPPIFKSGDFVKLRYGNKFTYKVLSYVDVMVGGNKLLVVPIGMPNNECQLHYASLFVLDTSYYRKLKLQKLLTNV